MRRPITIKHEMEKLASHSGLINIGALLDAIIIIGGGMDYES